MTSARAAPLTGDDPVAAVAAWRAVRAGDVDPVRFGTVEAMARRAAVQHGEARALIVARIDAVLADLSAAPVRSVVGDPPPPGDTALAALSALVDRLGRSLTNAAATPPAAPANPLVRGAKPVPAAPIPTALSRASAIQPLKSIVAHNGTWSRLRVEHRLRQALAQVPAGAGPLNTSHLVNRALEAMRDLSPAYLDAFMSHIDTLQWLEQASGAGDLTPRAATADGKRRAAAKAPRKG